jgi:hypothetical protein
MRDQGVAIAAPRELGRRLGFWCRAVSRSDLAFSSCLSWARTWERLRTENCRHLVSLVDAIVRCRVLLLLWKLSLPNILLRWNKKEPCRDFETDMD